MLTLSLQIFIKALNNYGHRNAENQHPPKCTEATWNCIVSCFSLYCVLFFFVLCFVFICAATLFFFKRPGKYRRRSLYCWIGFDSILPKGRQIIKMKVVGYWNISVASCKYPSHIFPIWIHFCDISPMFIQYFWNKESITYICNIYATILGQYLGNISAVLWEYFSNNMVYVSTLFFAYLSNVSTISAMKFHY